MRDKRYDSSTMREVRRSITCGSVSPSIVSASAAIPPMGVFSSWLRFATKSVRTVSMRDCSVTSSTVATIRPSGSRLLRMSNARDGDPAVSNRRCCDSDAVAVATSASTASSTSTSTCRTPVIDLAAEFLWMMVESASAITTPLGSASSASANTELIAGEATLRVGSADCVASGCVPACVRVLRRATDTPSAAPMRNVSIASE